jgi:hypothetical protein
MAGMIGNGFGNQETVDVAVAKPGRDGCGGFHRNGANGLPPVEDIIQKDERQEKSENQNNRHLFACLSVFASNALYKGTATAKKWCFLPFYLLWFQADGEASISPLGWPLENTTARY